MLEDRRPRAREEVRFGPFRLLLTERLLDRAGARVQLGARALDILIALVERAGEAVSKKELIAKVWSDVTVDEGSLRFHIVALRKALGEGQSGARYVATLPGRGYCFVAPIFRAGDPASSTVEKTSVPDRSHRIPARLKRMVGRDDAVKNIAAQLKSVRFITVVGPGGIGKTTVAVEVGHRLLADFDGAIRFLDLGPLSDPLLVPSAVASTLGLLVQSSDPTPGLIAFLREKRMLLILDSCEHVIETAAVLAEQIFHEAPQVHILATSRESLRVEGEYVHQLSPLETPPDEADLTAARVLAFPAAQLFVERVTATGHPFELNDYEAPTVAAICRRLDGIALAIELAASRVSAYGIQETAALIDNRFRLLWEGRRTALLRHQTLSATLDWSYDLLTEREQVILRRLSVFVGVFTLEAARSVAAAGDLGPEQVMVAIASLVAKSLVSAGTSDLVTRYRLLDTTRAYVLNKLVASGDADDTARRHARYYLEFLERLDGQMPSAPSAGSSGSLREHLGNIRAALEWSFFERGDARVGSALAAASVRLFLEMSLLTECHRWTERALSPLDEAVRGTRQEMELQAALGLASMFTRGNSQQVLGALKRGLDLAEQMGDLHNQLQLLGRLHIFHERIGDFHSALAFALRGEAVANRIGDPMGIAEAHSALGISRHLEGSNVSARSHLEAALIELPPSQQISTFHFGFDYRNRARIALARTLWLQGYSDQAIALAHETVLEANTFDHPITLCIALIWAVSVFLWNGDLDAADQHIDKFIELADRHSLAPYQAVGHGVKGELLVKRGSAEAGIAFLRDALETLHLLRYELLTTAFSCSVAEGLAKAGKLAEALQTIDDTIALVYRNGDLFAIPELLRIKGEILVELHPADLSSAEQCFARSLELARQQGALAWELRTATSLSRAWLKRDRREEARDLLDSVYDRLTEGLECADARAAKDILQHLARTTSYAEKSV